MSIQELLVKFKSASKNTEVLLTILIIVTAVTSFYLGRYSVEEKLHTRDNVLGDTKEPLSTQNLQPHAAATIQSKGELQSASSTLGAYVASKTGKKYHLPWCGSAKQIKEENKIWFQSKEEAEQAGYTPAANCKGM